MCGDGLQLRWLRGRWQLSSGPDGLVEAGADEIAVGALALETAHAGDMDAQAHDGHGHYCPTDDLDPLVEPVLPFFLPGFDERVREQFQTEQDDADVCLNHVHEGDLRSC